MSKDDTQVTSHKLMNFINLHFQKTQWNFTTGSIVYDPGLNFWPTDRSFCGEFASALRSGLRSCHVQKRPERNMSVIM